MWGSGLISIQRGTPKVAFVQASYVSFQKQLMLRKGNWKSAVILPPLCAQTHLCQNTHTYDGKKMKHTPLKHTAKSLIIQGSNPSQMSTLLSPSQSEVWDCSEISCWSPPAHQEGALPVYHFPLLCILCLSLSLITSRLYSRQPVGGWCQLMFARPRVPSQTLIHVDVPIYPLLSERSLPTCHNKLWQITFVKNSNSSFHPSDGLSQLSSRSNDTRLFHKGTCTKTQQITTWHKIISNRAVLFHT